MSLASLRAVAGAVVFVCAASSLAQDQGAVLQPGLTLLPAVTVEGVAVFPVISTGPLEDPVKYLSLAAGLERKEVRVREMGDGGDVNHVRVANNSDRPLLLLGGEVILGGQQDRVISDDTIVPPKKSRTVAVFCVEHGRWNGQRDFSRSGGFAESKIRKLAKYDLDQQRVWDQVAKKTEALGGQTGTGTYRTLAEGSAGKKVSEKFRTAVIAALDALPEGPRMVGIATAIGGKVRSVDVFASPALFQEYRAKLIDAIAVSAAGAPRPKNAPAATAAQVKSFVDHAEAAPDRKVNDDATSTTVQKRTGAVVGSKVVAKDGAAAGKEIFKSYQANE